MLIKQNSKYLDGEYCMKLWAELVTLQQVVNQLKEEGVVNPLTLRPPIRMAVSLCAWRWMLESRDNFDYAKKKYLEPLLLGKGVVWDDDDWGDFIMRHAKFTMGTSQKRYTEFLDRFPEYKKYDTMSNG